MNSLNFSISHEYCPTHKKKSNLNKLKGILINVSNQNNKFKKIPNKQLSIRINKINKNSHPSPTRKLTIYTNNYSNSLNYYFSFQSENNQKNNCSINFNNINCCNSINQNYNSNKSTGNFNSNISFYKHNSEVSLNKKKFIFIKKNNISLRYNKKLINTLDNNSNNLSPKNNLENNNININDKNENKKNLMISNYYKGFNNYFNNNYNHSGKKRKSQKQFCKEILTERNNIKIKINDNYKTLNKTCNILNNNFNSLNNDKNNEFNEQNKNNGKKLIKHFSSNIIKGINKNKNNKNNKKIRLNKSGLFNNNIPNISNDKNYLEKKMNKLLTKIKKNKIKNNNKFKDLNYSLNIKSNCDSFSEYKIKNNNINKNKLKLNIDLIKKKYINRKYSNIKNEKENNLININKSLAFIKINESNKSKHNIEDNNLSVLQKKNKNLNKENNIHFNYFKLEKIKVNKNDNIKFINNHLLSNNHLLRNNTINSIRFNNKNININIKNRIKNGINNKFTKKINKINNISSKITENKLQNIIFKNKNKNNKIISRKGINNSIEGIENGKFYKKNKTIEFIKPKLALNIEKLDTNIYTDYKNLVELCLNQGKIIFHLVGDVQNLNNQIEKKNIHIDELNHQLKSYRKKNYK